MEHCTYKDIPNHHSHDVGSEQAISQPDVMVNFLYGVVDYP